MSRVVACASGLAMLLASAALHADDSAADALFREGRELLKQGKYELACPKLAESHRLAPSSGVLLNLALCHEQQGRLATAYGEYLDTVRLATAQNKPARASEAEARATALRPRVPFVRITAKEPCAGLVVARDGEELPATLIGAQLPIDPGSHTISAKAPGMMPWSHTLEISPGDQAAVEVPPLSREPAAAAPPPIAPAKPAPPSAPPARPPVVDDGGASGRTVWIVSSAALAFTGLAVGTWFGVRALGTYRDAEKACPSHQQCSADVVDTYQRANVEAWVSNIGFGVGVLGAAASSYLVFTRPSQTSAASIVPAPGGVALSFATTF